MREVQIYKRLPAHNRLLKMVEYSDDKLEGYIVFEHMRNGSLESYLESGAAISYNQQLRWCIQAAEGVALLHASGIVHADIKPQNMLLDDKMSIRIIDMSGSSIDGLPPLCLESTRFFLPRPMDADMPCSITTDLFALGSSLYQIMQRVQPYAELEADKVELNYKRHIFPDVANLPCGSIISKCWQSQRTSSLPQRRSTGNLIATMILRQHSALWEKFRHEPCETDVGRSWGRARMKEKSPNKEAVRQQAGHYDGYWSNFKGARCL
jgi:serine/threonine protein kinase